MNFITVVLLCIIFAAAGFILGALVYRNNSKQFNTLTDKIIEIGEQVKDLKK